MSTWSEPEQYIQERLPKTLRYCKTCRKETPHEIRGGVGLTAAICIECLRRALSYELDRD